MVTNYKNFAPSILIVHPGMAHRDDFICACIALSTFQSINTVERREPTEEELESKEILVCDIGGRHEPSKLNFDHHQLARDAEPTCALTYLLRFLGLEDSFRLLDWFTSTEIMDSKGPFALAKSLGLDSPKALFMNLSPVEGSLLEMFQAGILSHNLMRSLGEQFIAHAKEVQAQMNFLKENANVVEVEGVEGLLIHSDNTKGIQKYRDTHRQDCHFSVCYDDRGDGWTLYRFNDCPRIDFSQLEGRDDILFAHKGGFIAKTKTKDSNVLDLVREAVIK